MGQKIKSVRQKIGGNQFDLPIALGADGKNIDMQSGLSLEEHLKINGLSDVDISEDQQGNVFVTETFYDKNKENIIGTIMTSIVDSQLDNDGDTVELTSIGSTYTASGKEFFKETVISSTASMPEDIQVREQWR